MLARDTWVKLTPKALTGTCIDSETKYGPTQGVGSVEDDNYGQVFIRWNAGLLAGSTYSWRFVNDLHVLTPAEQEQHQDWIDTP